MHVCVYAQKCGVWVYFLDRPGLVASATPHSMYSMQGSMSVYRLCIHLRPQWVIQYIFVSIVIYV